MNELHDLGPNTAHLNQKPENPFRPGDRVVKASDDDASPAVVVEVLPPEKNTTLYGQEMEGEAVSVAFPNMLDDGPGNWRTIHPAKLASYCDDQDIKLYTYKHTNLEYADRPFTPGDYVIKPDYDNPDLAVVVEVIDSDVSIVFQHHLDSDLDESYVTPENLAAAFDDAGIKQYTFEVDAMAFDPQY